MRETIKTDRLILRPLKIEDAKQLSVLGSNFDISRMTGSFPHPFPLLSAEFKIMYLQSKHRQKLTYPYAITQDGGDMIGIIDLFRRTVTDPLEIGYWVGRAFWGRGYATEAAKAIIEEARDTMRVTTLIAGVYTDNPASIKVLKKLGFEITGEPSPYFSMARLKNTESINLKLSLPAPEASSHCTEPQNSPLEALKGQA